LAAARCSARSPASAPRRATASPSGLGALGTGFAYVLNFNIVRIAGAQTGSMVTYLVPVFAVILGVFVLGEPLSWHEPAGGALIIAGVALAQRRPARRPSTL
jgi:drug/metabolite transporter (DMT)-like permease